MKRLLFRLLLRLYPRDFRARFAEEMLAVFEQAELDGGASGYCASVAQSLARQWTIYPPLLVGAGAVGGGLLCLGFTFVCAAVLPNPHRLRTDSATTAFLVASLGALVVVLYTLAVAVNFFRTHRRI